MGLRPSDPTIRQPALHPCGHSGVRGEGPRTPCPQQGQVPCRAGPGSEASWPPRCPWDPGQEPGSAASISKHSVHLAGRWLPDASRAGGPRVLGLVSQSLMGKERGDLALLPGQMAAARTSWQRSPQRPSQDS